MQIMFQKIEDEFVIISFLKIAKKFSDLLIALKTKIYYIFKKNNEFKDKEALKKINIVNN